MSGRVEPPPLATFVALESAVWDALVAGDAAADGRLLSDDFVGVYETGFATRADHMSQIEHGPSVSAYAIDQARILQVGPGGVLLSYRAACRRVGHDRDEVFFISSLWCNRDGRWVNVFSQDTPAAAPPG